MAQNLYRVLLWLGFVWPSLCLDLDVDNDFSEERWIFRHSQQEKKSENELACASIRPSAKDIVRRFYAILPYFDKDHTNTAFLHKFRGTVYSMSDSEDMLDREAGFYAAVLTPLVFLQQYRDTWCLLERFHRAIRLYQISHPTEKRSALKLLQNLRAVNQKIRGFIFDLPSQEHPVRTTLPPDIDEDETLHDKKDIRNVTNESTVRLPYLTETTFAKIVPVDNYATMLHPSIVKFIYRTTSTPDNEEDERLYDKKDIRYLKELIKNLG